ncbi:hypothetical protein HZS_2671 [Henneguya salminicola]|nr:hypothetical protein HZS_2671 [Henneguya salminicola]
MLELGYICLKGIKPLSFLFLRRLVGIVYLEDIVKVGESIIYEKDEQEKVKYTRYHWMDRSPERNAETLAAIIQTYVREGLKINADYSQSNSNVNNYSTHRTGNHSEKYANPITGACTTATRVHKAPLNIKYWKRTEQIIYILKDRSKGIFLRIFFENFCG